VQGFFLPAGGDARRELLNTFSYTCGFSVCAAKAGYRATSLDLSKKYLDWGRRNFELNGIDPAANDFIFGDCFDWMRRLTKKGRKFDVIILDPPTFSKSKESGFFRAEKDYGKLVFAALPLLNREGVLLASTNAAKLEPQSFLYEVRGAVRSAGRRIAREYFAGQPADFPVSSDEPAYLKTVWMRIA
jgi:23S rRNA (cytosine1962-C5)-methyltransferase